VPLCLKCGHSLCQACAKTLIKNGRIKCPFDNKNYETTLDQLGRNFSLLDLLDAEKLAYQINDPGIRICEVHSNKKVKLYCKTDAVFICTDCLIEGHMGHDVVQSRPLLLGESVNSTLS
jgi:hypothetical protein